MRLRSLPFAACLALWAASLLALWVSPACAQKSESDVFVAKAVLAYEEKRYEEAVDLLREALELDPKNVDALYYTGLVRIAQGRVDDATQVLEQARTLEPKDEAILFQLGAAYFSLGKYDQAQPLLEQVFAVRPKLDSLGYYVGFMRYRKKDYQGALRAFSAGTSADPNIQQLTRFYAGLALAILGLPEQAAAQVEEALRLQPGSALTGPAERLRDTILAARERERRFRAELRLGVFYDTNVPVVPEPSHDPTAESIRSRNRKSPGELAAARLEYSWLRAGPWEATLAYSFFQTRNIDLPKFNIQNHLGALGATYRGAVAAMPFQLGLQYAHDVLLLDNEEFLRRNTATLFGTLVETPSHLTTLQARLQTKAFVQPSDTPREEVRDGNNWMVGFTHLLRFESDRHFVKAGYQYDVEDTDGRNFEYAGHRYLAGGQYTLPWGSTRLVYDMDLHLRSYRHAHSLLPIVAPNTRERTDSELTHVVRIEQPLPRNFTLAAEYQAIIARSNLPVFSFNRNVFTLTLAWQY